MLIFDRSMLLAPAETWNNNTLLISLNFHLKFYQKTAMRMSTHKTFLASNSTNFTIIFKTNNFMSQSEPYSMPMSPMPTLSVTHIKVTVKIASKMGNIKLII